MKKLVSFIFLMVGLQVFALPHYELAYRLSGAGGMIMPDGKVDKWVDRPVLGGQFAVEFLPTGRWHCLQQWNNASIGVGVSYLNLGNEAKLGSAFAAYGYMNQPFYNGKHFRIGVRPSVGLAAVISSAENSACAIILWYKRTKRHSTKPLNPMCLVSSMMVWINPGQWRLVPQAA